MRKEVAVSVYTWP